MHHVRSLIFIFAFSFVAGSAFAGLAVSPGTPAHTHTDANTGGSTLSSTTLSGATLSGATLSGGSATMSSSWLRPSSDTDVVRVRGFSATQSANIFTVQNHNGASSYLGVTAAGNTSVTGALSVTGAITSGAVSATGTLSVTDTVSSTKGCASGHARSNPNYCYVTAPASTNLVRDTCTAVAAASADALATHLLVSATIGSANAIATRNTEVSVFSDSACATFYAPGTGNGFVHYLREFAAVAAGTVLGSYREQFFIPLPSTGATIYLRMADDAGDQGTAAYFRMGYGD